MPCTENRYGLNLRNPNNTKKEELHRKTSESNLSDEIENGRLRNLGHILRRNEPTCPVLQSISSGKLEFRSKNPAELVESYQEDLGTPKIQTWLILALTKGM